MSRRILLLVTCLLLAAPAAQAAQAAQAGPPTAEELELLISTLRSNRQAFIEVNLGLDAQERARFQPVYEPYQKEIASVQDRVFSIAEEYVASFRELTDEKAKSLIASLLKADEDRAKIRRAWLPRFEAVLPGRKVARFYQIENKIDALLRYELGSRIPVIEE